MTKWGLSLTPQKKKYGRVAFICTLLFLSGCFNSTPNYYAPTTSDHLTKGSVVRAQRGDTLYTISKRYDVDLRDLIDENRITPPYKIEVGQDIKLPKKRIYIVRKGQTVYSIARNNNLDVTTLIAINNLKKPYTLHEGQRLKLSHPKESQGAPAPQKTQSQTQTQTQTQVQAKPTSPPPSKSLEKKNSDVTWPTPLPIEKKPKSPTKKDQLLGKSTPSKQAPSKTTSTKLTHQASKEPKETQTHKTTPAAPDTLTDTLSSYEISQKPKSPVTLKTPSSKGEPLKNARAKTATKASVAKAPGATNAKGIAESGPVKFIWPLKGKLASAYGSKKDGAHNDGINLYTRPGTAVKAAESGTVAYAGDALKGYGNLILIKHRNGFVSAYAHLKKITVQKGTFVKKGEQIGLAGSTGNVSKSQLHFEIRKNAKTVNPMAYLR